MPHGTSHRVATFIPQRVGCGSTARTGWSWTGNAVMVTTFGGDRIIKVWASPHVRPATIESLPAGRLDGFRRLADGSLLVTSWDAGTVWRLWNTDEPYRVIVGLTSPAGVAVDTRRHRLAVTSFQRNERYLVPLH
jgi:hypothetical protein